MDRLIDIGLGLAERSTYFAGCNSNTKVVVTDLGMTAAMDRIVGQLIEGDTMMIDGGSWRTASRTGPGARQCLIGAMQG